MLTKQQILDDFTKAFKEKNEIKKRTLESIKSEILVFEKSPAFTKPACRQGRVTAGKKDDNEVTEEMLVEILKSMAKKRREAIEIYEQNGRLEPAAKEKEELAVIESYLPAQMSEEQVKEIATKIAAEQGLTKADFGKAMGKVMGQLKGRADGQVARKVLQEILGS